MFAGRTPQASKAFLNNAEAAGFLGLSPRTMEKLRIQGRGPRFHKFGRRVLYARGDLEAWTTTHSKIFTARR